MSFQPVPPERAEEQYLPLFADAFPENRGTALASAAHYRWKYRSPELGGPVFEFGGYEGGRLVSYYAALPYSYRVGERILPAAMVCDVMTRSDRQGRGIFTAMGRYATAAIAQAGIAFCTGYPVRPAVLPGHLKVGWIVAFPLPVYLKLLDPASLLRVYHMGWLAAVGRPALAIYHLACRAGRGLARPDSAVSWRTLSVEEFCAWPAFPDFCSRWTEQYGNCLVKSPRFLRWRLGAPGAAYRILAVEHCGALAAVAVTRRTVLKGLDVVAVLDLMIPRPELPLAGAVHDALADHARDLGAGGVALMSTQPDALRWQLAANGYWKIPQQFRFILKWLAAGPPPASLLDPAAWHLMWMDSDDL